MIQRVERCRRDRKHHQIRGEIEHPSADVVQHRQSRTVPTHHHRIGRERDPLLSRSHAKVFHVKGDAKVLANHHAGGKNLHGTASVGEHFCGAGGLMEPEFIHHHDPCSSLRRNSPPQDIEHVDNSRVVGLRPIGPGGCGSGCDNDHIGAEAGNFVGIDCVAVDHFDFKSLQLMQLVANDVAKLCTVRNRRRPSNLTAGHLFALVHGDSVPVGGRADGGL